MLILIGIVVTVVIGTIVLAYNYKRQTSDEEGSDSPNTSAGSSLATASVSLATKETWHRHKSKAGWAVGVLILLILGWWLFNRLNRPNRVASSSPAISRAQAPIAAQPDPCGGVSLVTVSTIGSDTVSIPLGCRIDWVPLRAVEYAAIIFLTNGDPLSEVREYPKYATFAPPPIGTPFKKVTFRTIGDSIPVLFRVCRHSLMVDCLGQKIVK